MLGKVFKTIKDVIIEERKFIIFLLLFTIILYYPLNYYITVGGGISDVSSRISVSKKEKSKGSFNISYVTQLKGNTFTYILSYIIPTWERESASNYKYDESEDFSDIQFRGDLDLLTVNGNATYWAYKLANKEVTEKSSKLYVIMSSKEYESPLKVQDEILSIDGKHYKTIEEYVKYLQTREKEDTVKVKVKRSGKEKEIISSLHEKNNRKFLGVVLQYVKTYKTNPKVEITFKSSESGPSGGLITTLEIYNQLTKKDLTNGLKIAGTGTIEEDGTIGQIGGVEHKILGAVSDKTDIFLVPSGKNYKRAKKYIKDKKLKIKLIKVENIKDAINKLEGLG